MSIESVTNQFDADFVHALRAGQTRVTRSLRQFVQEEVWIPSDGKHGNERWKPDRQPVQKLFFDEYNREHWLEIVAAGPSQSGKTLCCFDIPIAYHIAELCETTVVGVPDGLMVHDKWSKEIKPLFEASPTLRNLLPTSGPGSKGGKVDSLVTFTNGTEARFMTRGGSDQSKAGFTARTLVVTEAAGWTAGTETSTESDPLRQLRARQRSWDRTERTTVIEGTLTVEEDYPYSLRAVSSQSRILCPCPHCGEAILPGRPHLVGWHGARSEDEAAELARFVCPECEDEIDDELRRWAVERCFMVHGNQWVDRKGQVQGSLPTSRRLWFHWTGWHNLFNTIGSLAAEEWKKTQEIPDSPAEESAEKELCQFVWSVPYEPEIGDVQQVDAKQAAERTEEKLGYGICPDDYEKIGLGVDLGKRKGHFVWLVGRKTGRLHIPSYGEFDIDGDSKNLDVAIQEAVEWMWENIALAGLNLAGSDKAVAPNAVFVDCNFRTRGVMKAWKSITGGLLTHALMPIFGRGSSQMLQRYNHPRKRGAGVRVIGDQWHIKRHQYKEVRGWACFADVDYWKDTFHGHITIPETALGGLTIYHAPQNAHLQLAQHWAGEQRREIFEPGKGKKVVWERKTKKQHWFDGSVYARVGLDRAGWSVPTPGKTAA